MKTIDRELPTCPSIHKDLHSTSLRKISNTASHKVSLRAGSFNELEQYATRPYTTIFQDCLEPATWRFGGVARGGGGDLIKCAKAVGLGPSLGFAQVLEQVLIDIKYQGEKSGKRGILGIGGF